MAKHKEEKTNVMRTLDQKKIPYTAFSYDHFYTGLFYKFLLELLHTHTSGRSYGNHFKLVIF